MGEATINPKALEDAMFKALPSLFPNDLGTANNARVEFYDKFQREADEYDRDFMKQYEEDLNTTLVFAGLFSAVTSAFIIDVQTNLQPDFQELSYKLLKIVANASLGNPPPSADTPLPDWEGPDATVVHVQAILYSSLAASLLSAFVAMLGKQRLNRYARVEVRGSVVDRSRHRQRKMNGMDTWRFDLVMECLPLMLQAALLLLGYALSNYLFFVNKTVASVLIGFTTAGLLFYLLIVSAATLSYTCPFQTPLSAVLSHLIHFVNQHKRYLERTRKWFRRWWPPWLGAVDHVGLPRVNVHNLPTPLFITKETDLDDFVLDTNCITWLFDMSMDMDVIMAILRFIPEVVWHDGIRNAPLERVYDMILERVDRSSGRPVVIPKLRNMTYLSAKAFLHLTIQRQCISNESDMAVFKDIADRHQTMASGLYEGDSDLEVTLGIIDRIYGDSHLMHWQNFTFTSPHHVWLGHILLYRAWDALKKGENLPEYIKDFIFYSLRQDPPPSTTIIADCLLIVGLVLGIELYAGDLLVADKSAEVNSQIDRIYKKLTATFGNPSPTTDEINRALESLELIATLSENNVAQKSSDLFHVIMQSPVSYAYSQEKKWEASRLTMHGAYKWDKFLPWVGDPSYILSFLGHHFDLATKEDENQDEPIQNALRALAYASGPATIEALKSFDQTKPSFVRGICYVFQQDKPFQLRKAGLIFLALIGDKWFNTPHPIMESDVMRSLCVDWASAVDGIEHSQDVQKATLTVLFGMINSPHWRPHIVPEKWRLLEHVTSVPDDSQHLRRCVDNPELMETIKNVENPAAMTLWMAILWLRYKDLIPRVREQLETSTKEVAQGTRSSDLEVCLSAMDSEVMKAENALTQFNTWSTDPAPIALRTKIDNLQQARVSLVALREAT